MFCSLKDNSGSKIKHQTHLSLSQQEPGAAHLDIEFSAHDVKKNIHLIHTNLGRVFPPYFSSY